MITVLIRVQHGPEALATTLSALVPAVAAGLVADAVILATRRDEDLATIADAAGATLIVDERSAWRAGAEVARREWVLCLEDGDVPQEGWIRVLDRFISLGGAGQAMARMRRRRTTVAGAFREAVDRILGRSTVRPGDLVHRRVLADEFKAPAPVRLAARVERDPLFG